MHYNCLIVDDEIDLSKMTCEYFEMFGVSCAYVETATQCIAFLQENQVDVLLLDINLTEGSGFDLCKKVREQYDMPILFISARQSDDDILIALNIGGDDYIKKPYALSVLLAKVNVTLKRLKHQEEQVSKAEANVRESVTKRNESQDENVDENVDGDIDITINAVKNTEKNAEENLAVADNICLTEQRLSVIVNGKEVSFKAKEFALFKCLYEHRNTIVTKEQLFQEVWGDAFYSDGTLNVHIRKLREKLEDNPNEPKLIKTIWGTGYMLEV